MKHRNIAILLALSCALFSSPGSTSAKEALSPEGADLIGTPLPDWGELRFLDSPAHRRPSDFRGHVVLIRFWTAGCPYCRASAPTLTDWAHRYRDRGLVMIGIYHPKPPGRVSDSQVRKTARAIGLDALLAVDERWDALERLWLRGRDRDFTSASLLVGPDGVVRAVHRGGYLTAESVDQKAEYRAFAAALGRLLPGVGPSGKGGPPGKRSI